MGFIYSSLNRGAGESVALFDNRIARMLPFVTGKAYFDLRNYDAQTGEFEVYIEWDGELEAVLGYSLPAGGYFVKATTPQAYIFHRLDSGLPVYMKLIAQNGRLYPYRTYVMMDGRPFSVEFGGGVLIPFEDRYEELGCEAAKQTVDTGSQKLLMGSQSGMTGSQRFQWNGSRMRQLFGSQGGFRYLAGSQYRMIGSQRFRWNGSQMRLLFGSQGGFRYLAGSQYRVFGSRRMLLGSQRILSGSQYRIFGSQRIKNMLMVLESDTQQPQDSMDSIRTSQELMVEFPQEWQLINRSRRPTSRIGGNAKFGYGLDLI
ncbi:hypothetical protein GT568_01970 [Coprococcus sp. BIOML-A1]|uniref:hypothetical protein n=1 Tax=unclassified Coprococcus TaxID=2684943 RepID=UPI00136FF4F5|nr:MULTISPECIES: hypothetical protein [unclassified Coprococcus]MZK37629.1 hypothetical protein [Coprococcus sp. BIOML-A1]